MEHDGDEWVHNIQVQSGRLSKLITSLVALSRLDEENPFPVSTEFSLSDALWEISEPFGSLAQAKGKAYTQDIADGLTVTGDRTAIQQMFSILLDNALKYSPDGGSISLTTQRSGKRAEVTGSTVSYTHLDVYKRQLRGCCDLTVPDGFIAVQFIIRVVEIRAASAPGEAALAACKIELHRRAFPMCIRDRRWPCRSGRDSPPRTRG